MCMEREDANEDDLANVLNGTLPETRAEKCLSACLGEQYGTVSCYKFRYLVDPFNIILHLFTADC